jgi:catalase (peroxidase I)
MDIPCRSMEYVAHPHRPAGLADKVALAGVTAIEAMGGPEIPWEPGRTDYESPATAEEHRGQVGDR